MHNVNNLYLLKIVNLLVNIELTLPTNSSGNIPEKLAAQGMALLERSEGKGIKDLASFLLDRVGYSSSRSNLPDFTLSDRSKMLSDLSPNYSFTTLPHCLKL
ncbi:MAG: hypothetical protein PUP93_20230 [Rhizonema sp. NSF051]|nr:hypothetical protein [Rhizonema sp. NSF051]